MDPNQMVFLGIEISTGRRPFTYVALDNRRSLLALGRGVMDEVLAFAAGQNACITAIDAPSRPNQGLMERPEVRQQFSPPPSEGRWTNLRKVEYELHEKGIDIPRTGSTPGGCPKWMRLGFLLYQRLAEMQYHAHPHEDTPRQWIEVSAEAAFFNLLGCVPFTSGTLESRLQRQLVLFDRELPVPDPFKFFEEVTRHRLLRGILPVQDIFTNPELNAMVLAYTAWLVTNQPGEAVRMGAREEGEIILPRQVEILHST